MVQRKAEFENGLEASVIPVAVQSDITKLMDSYQGYFNQLAKICL
jgi:hypothetical protein